ncbi:peptidase domain-containing ABC transporter [Burkholderia multivorans]|jgi:subfamily B ATP-binding cassette protein HlyB/CyaB|uniref:peptidase domain-containing ABC transporter n=1 Tax=Burkholderia multivorans TaxID=87883 RepID=UPI001C216CD9|nr:peptidase domain-containing ABC transporter [Burkholderia multivorans]MBU9200205.1 peptidase domain-containing ABC transporter [Burkholderia multivorans]MDN8078668.1 peptidase domain-containing ABC transporter [Burkholderia multivorans]
MKFNYKQWLARVFTATHKPVEFPDASLETILWALEVQCGIQSVPFDRALVASRLEHAPSWPAALAILPELKLSARVLSSGRSLHAGADHGFVCFVYKDDAVTPAPALILKVRDEQALVWLEGAPAPAWQPLAEFRATLTGPLVELSRIWAKGEQRPIPFGYGWLLRELKRHKSAWWDVLASSLVIQAIALVTPLMTQTVIDKVITNRATSTLIALAVGLFILTLFSAALSWVRQYLVLHTGNRVDAVLGSAVFGHLMRLPIGYFEARPTGTLVTRLHGVETIRDFVTGAFAIAVLDVPFMLVFCLLMFYYSPMLSAITIGITLLMAAISYVVAPRLRALSNEQFMAGAQVQAFSTEYVTGIETVKALQMEGRVEAQYSQYMAEYMSNGFRARQAANTYNAAMTTLDQLSSMLVLGVGAWIAMKEASFTIGMLVAFQMMAGKVTQPLLRLSGLWQQFQQANIALKRLGDIMEVQPERVSLQPSAPRDQAPSLAVKELGFSYSPDAKPVYENLSFSIGAGQCVAIVGPSGCGKSTVAKLLQGFYPAYKGQVFVGGRELRTVAVNELRSWFGVVPQETVLFSGTVADNLHAAAPRATLAQLSHACKLAGVHEAIEALPKGYLTELGERGVGLSGGQKQRLAIARALLRGARILVFDEATANLDAASAEAIAQTVNALKGKLTIVFVAHHLPRGLQVDRVIKLPEGRDLTLPVARAPAPAGA